jgi:flavin-dependent dehydrogenase
MTIGEYEPSGVTLGEYEVVVIGGGPAGAACARRLARLGHDVLLAERATTACPQLGETCGPRARRLLGDGSVPFPDHVHRPLTTFASAWGRAEVERRSVPFWRAQSGLVLDRTALDRWLLDAAGAAGATVVRGCRITAGARDDRGTWQLTALVDDRPHALGAGFVVEATGRAARSVTQPDMRRWSTDLLICLSAQLPDRSGDDDALVEACRVGWWYTVRTATGDRVVALFTDADLVAPAPARAVWFTALLRRTRHVQHTVGLPRRDLRLRGCSARTSIRRLLWRDSYLAIGDAACFIDPLSGTGIERAIEDGISAADALSTALTGSGPEQLRAHALGRARAFQDGLDLQQRYYGAVGRWADEPFWSRRTRPSRKPVPEGRPEPGLPS